MTAKSTGSNSTSLFAPTFRDRWKRLTDDAQDKVVGSSNRPRVEAFIGQWDSTDDDAKRDAIVEGDFTALGAVSEEIRDLEARARALKQDRNVLYVRLLIAGETQARIAKTAGVTAMAVDFATGREKTPPKKRKTSRSRKPPGPAATAV